MTVAGFRSQADARNRDVYKGGTSEGSSRADEEEADAPHPQALSPRIYPIPPQSPPGMCCSCTHMRYFTLYRVGQNRIYTPYITVCLIESLPKIPYIHRIYMVLANPTLLQRM